MFNHRKYPVLEILAEAGVENAQELIGKVRVRIGGLNVSSPEQVINFQPDVKEVEIVVGDKKGKLTLEDSPKPEPVE